jgi:hypothetical protein
MDYYKKCSQCRDRDADLIDEGGLPKCYPCEVRLQGAAIKLLRDMLATSQAELKRYTAVYGDPDAPVEPPASDLDKGTPLLPGLADLILAAPQIKVGDHVRCESLGGVTGIVTSVKPTPNAGGYGCIMRDDEMDHEWFAVADLLEVIP